MAAKDAEITEALKDSFKIPTSNGTNTQTMRFNYNYREYTFLNGKNTYTLSFKYNNTAYTFIFTVTNNDYGIRIRNKCIKLTRKPDGELDSMISANSEENKCFDPILKTNSRNKPEPRIKNIDVLQVLKSKLALCLPENGKRVRLYDAARSDRVELSKFSIMRGGDGVYEKYGYSSELATKIKEKIPELTFDELNTSTQKYVERAYDKYLPGEPLLYNGSVMEILQKIPFEVENKMGVSEEVFNWMIEDAGYDFDEVATYDLNAESAAWKEWSKKLLFTDLKVEKPPATAAAAPAAAPSTPADMPLEQILAPAVLPVEERIKHLKNAIKIAENMIKAYKNEFIERALVGYRARLKELEAELATGQRGGRGQRGQTKKNRRRQ